MRKLAHSRVGTAKTQPQFADTATTIGDARGDRVGKIGVEAGDALARLGDDAAGMADALGQIVHRFAIAQQFAIHHARERRAERLDALLQLVETRHDHLRGRGGSGRAQVGDKISDSVIDFVADGGNHRDRPSGKSRGRRLLR